jgi:phosphopantothenoylcysteine decarboxylase/phosphopantothenate--cysteine ligase
MRFVVTAGPTREHLDPVRFLSNPSTGRMGFAVARAARAAGHEVTLVAGPVSLKTPPGVRRINVISARDMLAAVLAELGGPPAGGPRSRAAAEPTALVMTAAVADWRPARCAARKLKKSEMSGTLKLVRNPDILKTVNRYGGASRTPRPTTGTTGVSPVALIRIGFAAETGAPDAEAARKCREKGLDLVVGNDVTEPGSGFGTDTNRVTFVTPDGNVQRLPLMSKLAVARRIVSFAERRAKGKE